MSLSDSRNRTEALIKLLHHTDWGIRMQAAQHLGDLGNIAATESLIAVLQDYSDIWVAIAAATALGKIKDTRAIPALIDTLYAAPLIDDYEKQVSTPRTEGSTEFGDAAALYQYASDIRELRAQAAWALGEIGAEAALPALQDALYDHHETQVQPCAAHALAKIHTKKKE